jgi:NAD(P)-dependent dehydrogenase (short-subunit alcohol dehydrogenase family)
MGALSGKVALVTGAGRRLGAVIARTLGAEGAALVVHYHTSEAGAQEAVRAIEQAGGQAIAVRADLKIEADVRRLFATARERFGRLDLVVSSAGVFEQVPFEELELDAWEQMLRTNLTSAFLCAREALPLLKESEGQIVHIADIAGLQAWPGYAHYCVSKAGLIMLTRCLAVELAPHDVRVNAVAPGAVLFPDDYPEEDARRVVARIPLSRSGEPEDVARTVLFLAAGPTFITGQVICVDGGRSIAP